MALKRYRYRAYPTGGQRQAASRLFGCARTVWNDALAAREAARLSGTAIDINATKHPAGKRGTMAAAQEAACRAIEKEAGGVLRWGVVVPDEMHWEIAPGVTPQQVAAFAAKIRKEMKR